MPSNSVFIPSLGHSHLRGTTVTKCHAFNGYRDRRLQSVSYKRERSTAITGIRVTSHNSRKPRIQQAHSSLGLRWLLRQCGEACRQVWSPCAAVGMVGTLLTCTTDPLCPNQMPSPCTHGYTLRIPVTALLLANLVLLWLHFSQDSATASLLPQALSMDVVQMRNIYLDNNG